MGNGRERERPIVFRRATRNHARFTFGILLAKQRHSYDKMAGILVTCVAPYLRVYCTMLLPTYRLIWSHALRLPASMEATV